MYLYFCNHIVLLILPYAAHRIFSLANQMDLSIVCHAESSLELAEKSHFGRCHTFQHCSKTFKLNKRAKCLSLSINVDGIELKPFDAQKPVYRYSIIICVFSHRILLQSINVCCMYASVCVCMYVCMYIHTYVGMYVCSYYRCLYF